MKCIALRLSIALLVSILSCASAWAQATAEISGTVRDGSGAVLPGVDVSATHTDTGVTRSTVTNETGNFAMPNMPLGPHRLEAALPGFRTFVQTGIVLQVNSSVVINPVLELGQVSESIEVRANASAVETRSQGVGQVIENAKILEMPLNGRNVTELITLAPATVYLANSGAGAALANLFNRNTSVSIAGGWSYGVSYTLDGANHNQPINNQNMSVPFPDALQEFKVETSATNAQSGTHSAGGVTLVTKSGTNEFHGDLFEFVRNYKFNARNAFAQKRDSLKRNQFGGTIGGPIIKNRLFFFGGYQGTTIRTSPTDTTAFVPTPAMLAGDFTAVTSPACNTGRQITLRGPFVNNQVDPARFSKVTMGIVNRPDYPTTSNPCGRILWGDPTHENQHLPIGKIDYQVSSNHSIFARYLAETALTVKPYDLTKNLLSLDVDPYDALNQAFSFGDTYTFGPSVVNAFRFWTMRTAINSVPPDSPSWKGLGANFLHQQGTPQLLTLTVTGGATVGESQGRRRDAMADFGLSDDLSWLRGGHQFNLGFNGSLAYTNLNTQRYAGGLAAFTGATTGLGMADFLLGEAFTFSQASNQYQYGKQWLFGIYGADTWKATRNLTVNLGLRWEPYFPFQWTDGAAYSLSLDDLQKGTRSTQFVNAPPGWNAPGDPNFRGKGNAPWNPRWWNFSPRLGLAWDATGDGRTSVRAAVGTFYDFVPSNFLYGITYAPPTVTLLTTFNVKMDDPWSSYPGGNPFPLAKGRNAPFPSYSNFAIIRRDTRNPNVQHWNFSVQRSLSTDWLVSASYLGSHTIHFWTLQSRNPAIYIPGSSCVLNGVTYSPCSSTANTNQRRALSLENPVSGQFFANVNELDDGATQSYNGLILTMQGRLRRGISTNLNYTWAHCIGMFPYGQINAGIANQANTDPRNREFDRGNCASDRRHILTLTGAVETPPFSNRALQAVAGRWKFAPLLRVQSGDSMSITSSQDLALSGIIPQRVSQVLPNVFGDKSVKRYLNPAAFAPPAVGTVGNMRWNTIRGPGYWGLDMAFSKEFRRTESQKVEIRAEAFNVTNSFRPNDPTTVFESNTFGQLLSARDPRIMQFALKYFF